LLRSVQHWAGCVVPVCVVCVWGCSTRVPKQHAGTVQDRTVDASAKTHAVHDATSGETAPMQAPRSSESQGHSPTDAGAQPAAGPVRGSGGCGVSPPFVGRHHSSAKIAGKDRSYDVWVPIGFDNRRPLALVFVFHGAGGTIADAIGMGLQDAVGALENAIYVFPQALAYAQYGVGWDPSCSGPDVQLVQHIRAELADGFCTSPERVFATGFSWGGDFANVLGCCQGTTFRAVASASGAEWGPEVNVNANCGTAGASAYRLTYGSADTSYPSGQFDAVTALFRKALGCRDNPQPAMPAPCLAYQGCSGVQCADDRV
jgi:polyhydroxybutyrate depolymerase